MAPVLNYAETRSFDIRQYPTYPFNLIDIPGYNGTAERNKEETLQKFKTFTNKMELVGISLIIYVMRKGRINDVSRKYYKYFVRDYCEDKVPVLLVVTHCEEENDNGFWYGLNNKAFLKYGMIVQGVVSGCTSDPYNLDLEPELLQLHDRKRAITGLNVIEKIHDLVLQESWKPSRSNKWIQKALKLERLVQSEPEVHKRMLYYFPKGLTGDKVLLNLPHLRL